MQIVINIPEWKYKSICEGVEASKKCDVVGIDHAIHEAIYNGIILPKGHGRIADIDKLIDEKCNECGHIRGVSCTIPCYEVRRISSIPTIIEADKEVKNVKNADSN